MQQHKKRDADMLLNGLFSSWVTTAVDGLRAELARAVSNLAADNCQQRAEERAERARNQIEAKIGELLNR